MTLIDGDRIITAQLYDDEYEEFTEKKMSIIDYINAYTDEGVTIADVVEQTEWISVSEGLPKLYEEVIVTDIETTETYVSRYIGNGFWECDNGPYKNRIIAWQPLPQPYKTESEE